jgi:hypothetical protein
MDSLPPRSEVALKKQYMKNRQGRTEHSTLREQVVYPKPQVMWPTPTTETTMRKKKYAQGGTPLTLAVQMWPTPTVGCVEGGEQSDRVERTDKGGFILRKKNKPHMTYGAKLSDAILFEEKQKMWPTPTAGRADQGMSPSQEKRNSLNLAQTVQVREGFWPTPTVNDSKNNAGPSQLRRTGSNLNVAVYKQEGIGTLNPMWVEWLMGYPIGWTDLED